MKKQIQTSSTKLDRKSFEILVNSAKAIGFTDIELQQLSKVYEQTVTKPANEVQPPSKPFTSGKTKR